MKKKSILVYLLAVLSFCPSVLFAQLAIKLELNRKNFIRYENVYAKVLVRNLSAHPLIFGNHEKLKGDIRFSIETPTGNIAKRRVRNYSSSLNNLLIEPGKTEHVIVPLSKVYNIGALGEYKVKVIISQSLLPNSYQSEPVDFNVTAGTVVWEADVGVPTVGEFKDKEKIQKRQYKLLSFFDGEDRVYCLRVEDKNYVYGVARIGLDIGNRKPVCKIDRVSKVHILLQASPQIYSYFVYDTDCRLEESAVYKKTGTEPCLVRNPKTGKIFVAGGEKAKEGRDYVMADETMK